MTGPENERLAVVETKVSALVLDVSEIKADVKLLLAARSQFSGGLRFLIQSVPFVALGASIFAIWGGR